MGLKNKINKMKNFFFDEEEEEIKPIKKIVKEDNKSNITKLKKEMDNNVVEKDFFDNQNDIHEIKTRTVKKEKEFSFPEFNDDDFAVSLKKPEPIIKQKRDESKIPLYQGSKRKDEFKKFKPSPIISPIYGLLDDEGKSVSKEKKESMVKEEKKDVSLDIVRKKAYGKFDEEFENTIKRLNKKTIEEAEKEMEDDSKKLSRSKQKEILEKDELEEEIFPGAKFEEPVLDNSVSKNKLIDETDEDDEDTKEQDLFNLIDNMYSKNNKED